MNKFLPEITPFRNRFQELEEILAKGECFSDQKLTAKLAKEHQKLSGLLEKYNNLETTKKEIEDAKILIADKDLDVELQELASEELTTLQNEQEALEDKILVDMIPEEDSDSKNTILEIRAGTGGDEASLFAADLYRMYTRLSENKGWTIEIMSSSPSETGGLKEIICLVSGNEVYKTLKFESGGHRVQRIPATESGGRIHTSSATVAVLPEAKDVDVEIKPEELEISICRASGPGGQGVNTTDSAVQILHKPTGLIVTCADERSQLKNRTKAMTVLRSRLLKQKEEEERKKYAENRKQQVGTGDRSDRIRTYNFPQNRVTDHRINLTLYSLTEVMEGSLSEITEALMKDYQTRKIQALCESISS